LLTVIVAALSYLWVYNYPATAEFLSEEEREFIQLRLKYDSDATHDERFTWGAVLKAFTDPKVWLYGLGFHTISLPLYTLSLFLVSPALSETCRNECPSAKQMSSRPSSQDSATPTPAPSS
jgi:hypothetical protein